MDEIIGEFDLDGSTLDASLPLNWNIAPTNEIYIIRDLPEKRVLDSASWGIIAPWQKNFAEARASQSHAINARSESIHEKPTFRQAFRTTRCLIPATGYYEWATSLGKYPPKQPFYITSAEPNKSLSIAGIWSTWKNEKGEEIQSAAIITREVVGILTPIHHRMPVILSKDLWSTWLSSKSLLPNEIDDYLNMIDIKEADKDLVFWPVSDDVNNARNTGPTLAQEIAVGESGTLF